MPDTGLDADHDPQRAAEHAALSAEDLKIDPAAMHLANAAFIGIAVIAASAFFLDGPWQWILPLIVIGPPLVMFLLTPRYQRSIGGFLAAVGDRWLLLWRAARSLAAQKGQRWAAAWWAFRRWLTLALGRKEPERIAEMAAVQGFLGGTVFAPFRFLAIAAGAVAAIFAGLWAWAALITVPGLEARLAAERAVARQAIAANAALAERTGRAEADAVGARLAMNAHAQRVLQETAAAAERAERRARTRARLTEQQQEILNAGRNVPDDQPFDGERWLRERAARDRDLDTVPGVPGDPAAAAGPDGVPDGARSNAAASGDGARQPR